MRLRASRERKERGSYTQTPGMSEISENAVCPPAALGKKKQQLGENREEGREKTLQTGVPRTPGFYLIHVMLFDPVPYAD